MKWLKMGIATLVAVSVLSLGYGQEAQACNKTANCYAKGESVTCGYVQGRLGGMHVVTEPNGYSSYCGVTVVSGDHIIKCAGCGAVLRTQFKTCSETHSNVHCFSRANLCK